MNLELGSGERFSKMYPVDLTAMLPGNRHRLRVRIYALLLILDCAAILSSFLVANLLRLHDAVGAAGINILVLLLPLYVAIAANGSIYGVNFFHAWHETARKAVTALFAASFAVLFAGFYLQASARMSREVFTIGVLLSAIALPGLRFVVHRWVDKITGGHPLNELMICDGVPAPPGHTGYAVDAAALDLRPVIDDPRSMDRIGQLLKAADRVIIACPDERRVAWAAVLKGANIKGEIAAPELAALGTLGASRFAGTPTLLVSVGPLDTRNRAIKRALDLTLALGALLVLAPLMLVTALAIRLESAGPVFFVQSRLGRGNRLFAMYKFRSMHAAQCDSDGNRSTQRGDARVTRVGRIIRATSIDELPQILNVIRGDMSIVGPRPHALGSLAGDKLFWEVDQRYWHRHAAKPGITGLAQVRGFRGATHLQSDLADRLQADLDYLNRWSIWRDLRILVATFGVVLHRNAY